MGLYFGQSYLTLNFATTLIIDFNCGKLWGMETTIAKNGAVRDKATGRIVAMPELSRDKAREMVRAREEKRIRLYNIGANRSVQDAELLREFGEDAHLVERGMTLQTIASTPDAGKAAVMAAQHLDKAQGYDVKQIVDEQPTHTTNNIVLLMIQEAHKRGIAFDNSSYRNHEVVDGETDEA